MVRPDSNVQSGKTRDISEGLAIDNANAGLQNGKRRGRPRVDVQDKTSADVSRVSISLFDWDMYTKSRAY